MFSVSLRPCFGQSVWPARNKFFFGEMDDRAHRVLKANRNALIMPRIYLGATDWWRAENPDELILFGNGERTAANFAGGGAMCSYESVASEKWRQDTAGALEKIVEHIRESDYADHIFGYALTGMQTEEWYHYVPSGPSLGDFSRPNTLAFQRWLTAKYGTVEALRQAWADPTVTFETAKVPTKKEREGEPAGTFLDPARQMKAIDFHRFHNEIVAETIDYFAAVAKRVFGGRKVVGAFYGYMFEANADPAQGHQAMGKLLQSPNLDYIMVTASYGSRGLGDGADYVRSQATSVALHNKLWYHDNDSVSYLYRQVMRKSLPGLSNEQIENTALLLGAPKDERQTTWLWRRSAGFVLGWGFYGSLFDLHGGYFHDPVLMAEVARHYKMFDDAKRQDRRSCAQILMVSDELSAAYPVYDGIWEDRNILPVNLHDPQPIFCKIGAPHDSILTDDLARVNINQYKVVVFLNPYHLTDAQRRLIHDRVLRGGRTAVWCYAPGLFNGGKMSVEAMEELTGIKIAPAKDEKRIAPMIGLADGNHPLLGVLRAAGLTSMGHDRAACQLFSVDDPAAIVLGTLPGGTEATFAVKSQSDWTSVYTITAKLPAAAWRALARYAGVHIYNASDDTLYASRSYLTLSAGNRAGSRTICFPHAVDAFDAVSGRTLCENVKEFTRPFQAGETLIVRYAAPAFRPAGR